MVKKTRGAVAPGKIQCNIRLRIDLLDKVKAEAGEKGFKNWVAFLHYLLQARYYPEKRSRR